MRALGLVAALAACSTNDSPRYGVCSSDSECGGSNVCARSGECVAATDLAPPVTLRWTLDGQPPDASTCARAPTMHVVLIGQNTVTPNLTLSVPCTAGTALVLDRIPWQLIWMIDVGPAGVPDPETFPNHVGWDSHTAGAREPIDFELTF